ncbi:MAG: metal-sulfur cluster assembly factor [Myxococcota bacterium]|nr:metal-sulfur cluster assembly factor [Myxococcota bacterium]
MSCDAELLLPLRTVIDPELGINIIDLGLVYQAHREGDRARVQMTMTTPACPMGPYLEEQVKEALLSVPLGLTEVEVEVTFDPPWSPEQMTPEARAELGVP